ncbi:MAG: hypothetical protein NVSMB62_08040 [Acidobacteriaceae bacterium]
MFYLLLIAVGGMQKNLHPANELPTYDATWFVGFYATSAVRLPAVLREQELFRRVLRFRLLELLRLPVRLDRG